MTYLADGFYFCSANKANVKVMPVAHGTNNTSLMNWYPIYLIASTVKALAILAIIEDPAALGYIALRSPDLPIP